MSSCSRSSRPSILLSSPSCEDHELIALLIGQLEDALARGTDVDEHLDGLAAIMESHFRFEERDLLPVLQGG